MRILVVNWRDIKHPEAGGAEIYVHNLCTELVKMGHAVHLFSAHFPMANNVEEIEGVRIMRYGGRFSVYVLFFRYYLRNKRDYDVVLESINTIPFCARLYATQPVVPIIYSINNAKALMKELGVTPISVLAWLFNSFIAKIYGHSYVLTISSTSKNELASAGFDAKKVFVAEPNVNPAFDEFVKTISPSNRPNYTIIYLGRLKKYKGIDILLEAVAILKVNLPVKLLIVGKGDYEYQLRRKVKELGLNNCVHFSGFVDETEKVVLLKNSSVFACCSIDEGGWTIAGLEAMRCGVPIVVTDSQRDLVREGVTGFITPPKAEIVAEKIRAVLLGEWTRMSEESIKLSSYVSWTNSATITLKALQLAIIKYSE